MTKSTYLHLQICKETHCKKLCIINQITGFNEVIAEVNLAQWAEVQPIAAVLSKPKEKF